jgi:hypothetical protein
MWSWNGASEQSVLRLRLQLLVGSGATLRYAVMAQLVRLRRSQLSLSTFLNGSPLFHVVAGRGNCQGRTMSLGTSCLTGQALQPVTAVSLSAKLPAIVFAGCHEWEPLDFGVGH